MGRQEAVEARAAELADKVAAMGPAMTFRTLVAALLDEQAPFLTLADRMEREAPKPQVGGFIAEEIRRVAGIAS